MSDTVWRRGTDWVGTGAEDSFVMINLESGTSLTLHRTASVVWTMLATSQTQRMIEAELTRRFDVSPEVCAASVTALLRQIRDLKIAAPI